MPFTHFWSVWSFFPLETLGRRAPPWFHQPWDTARDTWDAKRSHAWRHCEPAAALIAALLCSDWPSTLSRGRGGIRLESGWDTSSMGSLSPRPSEQRNQA
ncbi:hypothetical protein B0H67DRAFT_257919 [Lasiosphaeris hirsuta]|uniref:Uncharacterized protein n=1 Tax=Lasiosphaeris hirsuta TaxID=260670 RepID=A0AA40DX08_9PEZI|nr:hypothetical protein B0H67DRAFT_257919 [Lasiosphaeris hirsuta]